MVFLDEAKFFKLIVLSANDKREWYFLAYPFLFLKPWHEILKNIFMSCDDLWVVDKRRANALG